MSGGGGGFWGCLSDGFLSSGGCGGGSGCSCGGERHAGIQFHHHFIFESLADCLVQLKSLIVHGDLIVQLK